jgi:hypothetical protein
MSSINEYLNDESATKDIFEILDKTQPEQAKTVYKIAQRSLVKGKAYALMNKYIVPHDDYREFKESYVQSKTATAKLNPAIAESRLKFYDDKFANNTTTLVAILVVNDRMDEATKIAAAARTELDSKSFRDAVGRALKGVFPEPWP